MGVSASIAAFGLYTQAQGAKEQKKATQRQVQAQREQQIQQKKLADIKSSRERRRLAREARIARSQILVASGGNVGSSLVRGATGSVGTQVASTAGFQGQQEQIADNIFAAGGRASQASSDIASAAATQQTGSAIFGLAQVTSKSDIFKSSKPTT